MQQCGICLAFVLITTIWLRIQNHYCCTCSNCDRLGFMRISFLGTWWQLGVAGSWFLVLLNNYCCSFKTKKCMSTLSTGELCHRRWSKNPKLQYIIDKWYSQIGKVFSNYFVFLANWTFFCHVLGSLHCSPAYTETVDPACRPSIPQPWYWHHAVLYGRGQLG